jgi:hypothetical protein
MYKYLGDAVHGEVLDYPGVITAGGSLSETRLLLAAALVDMAEADLMSGRALPLPDPSLHDPESDLEEPIHLLLQAATRIEIVPAVA